MIKQVGFIGIGVMGRPMVEHLLEAGYEVTIYYHRDPAKLQPVIDKGARLATTLAQVARGVQAVFTMLPNEDIVRSVLLDEGGVADNAAPGTVVVNTSTVSADSNIRLAKALGVRGLRFLDSPVTGSGLQAQAGTLVFIAGGDRATYQELVPLYGAMGAGSYHGGEVGAGSHAKLASNTMMAINLLSFCEALTMAVKAGVDPEMFVKFTSGGGPQSAMADKKIGKVLSRDFSPAFRAALLLKDMNLASSMSKEFGVPTPVLGVVKELLHIACREGLGDEDVCAVIKCYEKWSDVQVKRE